MVVIKWLDKKATMLIALKSILRGNLLIAAIVLLLYIVGMFVNLNNFVFGSNASFTNFLATVFYYLGWTYLIVRSGRIPNKKFSILSIILWFSTTVALIVTLFISFTQDLFIWSILVAIVFLPPIYGIKFVFTNNVDMLKASIIISFSLVVLAIRYYPKRSITVEQ